MANQVTYIGGGIFARPATNGYYLVLTYQGREIILTCDMLEVLRKLMPDDR